MAESSWPGKAPTVVAEAQFEQMMSWQYASGIVGDVGDPPLLFADSTGLQVKLRANRFARVRGFTWWSGNDGDTVLPLSGNASGQTRVDRVVLRLDRSTWEVRAVVKPGTPGSGPPAVTTDVGDTGMWELWAGDVTVANNASTIVPANVAPRTTFMGPPLLLASGNDLPDPNVPQVFLRYRPDQDRLILHRQGAPAAGQADLWSDSGDVALHSSNSAWTASGETVIRKVGTVVQLRIVSFQRTAGNLSANSTSTLPGVVPAAMRHPSRDVHIVARTSGHDAARIRINRSGHELPGRIVLINHSGISTGQFVMPQDVTWLVP